MGFGDKTLICIHSSTSWPGLPSFQLSFTLFVPAAVKLILRVGQERPPELTHMYSTVVGPLVVIAP
jgi:hypothetical protein